MGKRELSWLAASTLLCGGASAATPTPALLSGDERTACEVILCLSTGQRPSACSDPLRRFFSIRHRRPHKQIRKRMEFLDLCPDGGAVDRDYHRVLATSGQSCDMESLLTYLNGYEGDPEGAPTVPRHCELYARHPLTYAIEVPVQREYCAEIFNYEYGYRMEHCIQRWVDPGRAETAETEAAMLREIEADAAERWGY